MFRKKDKPKWDKTGIGIAFTSIVVLGIGYLAYTNVGSLHNSMADSISSAIINTEEEEDDEGGTVEASFASQTSPSYSFITEFAKFTPEGYSEPQVQMNGTASTFVSWICGNIDLDPAPTMGTRSDYDKKLAVITHTYGAGQATRAISEYESGASYCDDNDGNGSIYQWSPINVDADGFVMSVTTDKGSRSYVNIWSRGDVVIAVSSPSVDDLRDVSPQYDAELLKRLETTQCLAVEESSTAYVRSPYYDPEDYKGWERGRDVSVPDNTFQVDAGILSSTESVSDTGRRIGVLDENMLTPDDEVEIRELDDFVSVPESPIPDGIASSLPSEPEGTSDIYNLLDASSPSKPSLTGTIPERVVDPEGPGCGWIWSGQVAPEWDDSEEKSRVDALVGDKEIELSNTYSSWLDSYNDWYTSYVKDSVKIHDWNEYVDKANSVTSSWREVNSIRADYRSRLDAYWSLVEEREAFIEEQEEAQAEYDALVLQCEADSINDSNGGIFDNTSLGADVNPSPTPLVPTPTASPTPKPTTPKPSVTPTPTPSVTPTPEPDPCPPARPEILDQDIPDMPVPPALPEIPLPDSWDDIPDYS